MSDDGIPSRCMGGSMAVELGRGVLPPTDIEDHRDMPKTTPRSKSIAVVVSSQKSTTKKGDRSSAWEISTGERRLIQALRDPVTEIKVEKLHEWSKSPLVFPCDANDQEVRHPKRLALIIEWLLKQMNSQ